MSQYFLHIAVNVVELYQKDLQKHFVLKSKKYIVNVHV